MKKKKKNIDFSSINFTRDSLYIHPDVHLTFGSIAKGFIIDKVVEFLQENGVTSGIVNAGGDIKMFGQKKPLKVGIKHPRKEGMATIDILNLQNTSVVTTGDYERYFIKKGKRYHHIINPKTGYPSDTIISITVIHPSSLMADTYSTGLFLLSPEEAIKVADSIENLAIIIYFMKDDEIVKKTSYGVDIYD